MTNGTSTRDYSLDFFRACLLAYIVCIIHSVSWLGNGAEPYESIMLVEMPLIFFVAGASANLAGYHGKTFKTILSSRVRRILLPYLIYVAISLILSIFISHYKDLHISELTLRSLLVNIVLGGNLPVVPYAWQLWFIPVYFLVSISTPLQVWIIGKLKGHKWPYLSLCVALWGSVWILVRVLHTHHNISQVITQVLLYNIFYMMGFFYYKQLRRNTLIWMALAAALLLGILSGGDLSGMNTHKFSQDHIFLIFGTVALLIFSIIFSFVKVGESPARIFRFGLDRWNKYGYTFYLWQSWSFFVLVTIAEIIEIPVQHCPKSLIWVVPSLYIISWALSWIIVPTEQYFVRRFSRKRVSQRG